jgi:hypothetical protein
MYPREMKAAYKSDTCAPISIAKIITVAKQWNQSRHPSTDEWIKKIGCICTMECYSTIKKYEMLFLGK